MGAVDQLKKDPKQDQTRSRSRRGPGRRPGVAPIKRTKPTTVRFHPHLLEFIKAAGAKHDEGQSGVINDAVEFYMNQKPQGRRCS